MQTISPSSINTPQRKSLGRIFPRLEVSTEEAQRLAKLAASDTLVRYVVTRYARLTEPYREVFSKKEKVKGFRQGKGEAYHKEALRVLVDILKSPSDPRYVICWEIYKQAAVQYIQKELCALDKLMSEIGYDADLNARDLLTAVCSNAAYYDVSQSDVSCLYEVWWIPRIDDFESVLALCSQKDEAKIQAKQLQQLASALEKLREHVATLTQQVDSQSARQVEANQLLNSQAARSDANQELIRTIETKITGLLDSFISDSNSRFSKFDEKFLKTSTQVSAHEELLREARKTQNVITELRKKIEENTSGIEVIQQLQVDFTKEVNDVLTKKNDELEEKLQQFAEQITSRERAGTSQNQPIHGTPAYRSPLLTTASPPHAAYKLSKEIDFLSSWSVHLSRTHGVTIPFEQLVAFHCVFLANKVAIGDLKLLSSWIHCLGWNSFSKDIVASPIWSAEEDWSIGALHLFSELKTTAPKLLVIHNYDVGIVDCYLAPTLLLWSLQDDRPNFHKLFLVPGHEPQPLSPQVLEHAATVSLVDCRTECHLRLLEPVPQLVSSRKELPLGVEPKIANQWIQKLQPSEHDLTTIQNSMQLDLSDWVVSAFHRTVSVATRFFDDASAVGVGMKHHVLPWVRAKYGESSHNDLDAYLRQLPGVNF